MRHKALGLLVIVAVVAAALVAALPAVAGSNPNSAQVTTFDPTGAQFTCTNATYTAIGGTVQQVLRDSFDANGTEHFTGTVTPKASR